MAVTESTASQLAQEARLAGEVRALLEDPNVVALKVETVRKWTDRFFATAVILALLFTMVTVQQFASHGFPTYSFPWFTAWLLDPMFSLALIAVLVAEVVTARYQIKLGQWAQISKWFFLLIVLVMNIWIPFAAGIPSGVILHAGPVLLVFVIAQVAPEIRERLTEAVLRAERITVEKLKTQVPVVPTPFDTTPVLAAEAAVDPSPVNPPHRVDPASTKPTKPSTGVAPTPTSKDDLYLVEQLRREWIEKGHRPGTFRMAKELKAPRRKLDKLISEMPDPTNGRGSYVGSSS